MKVVINSTYGGFSLSPKAMKYIADKTNTPIYFFDDLKGSMTPLTVEEAKNKWAVKMLKVADPKTIPYDTEDYDKYYWDCRPDNRTDPLLIEVVEILGEEANGTHAKLKVVEVPDDVKWHIDEYDGWEHVAEDHRTWG